MEDQNELATLTKKNLKPQVWDTCYALFLSNLQVSNYEASTQKLSSDALNPRINRT